ncbi:M50 family peptidase [Salibacterium salarium]|uniref:M50 family peptidase n=2 Tax=Salibacterium salarium TaxID=284579 RepID=A0A3R9P5L0_9BACI|nr:M50 family peptidase [Salibacterium salarium]
MTLLLIAGAIGILMYVPVIGSYLSIFYTLIHESGHALAAVLTGGKVKSISLFSNTEGLASTRHHKFGFFITSIAGYPFASIVSVLFMYVLQNEWYNELGIALLVYLVFSALFWVRNSYGVFWITTILLMAYFIWSQHADKILVYVLTGVGFILLVQAFISCWHILILSIRSPESAGDASMLSRLSFIPAPFWGFLFFMQGMFFFALGCGVWLGINPFNYLYLLL